MPCWGNCDLISRRITASAARSASVTGSKSWLALLLSIESDVRKDGRMVSPEAVASRPMKAEKSMTVTLESLEARPVRRTVVLPSSIGGAAHDDPAFSVGILDIESARCRRRFSGDGRITKSRYHQLR